MPILKCSARLTCFKRPNCNYVTERVEECVQPKQPISRLIHFSIGLLSERDQTLVNPNQSLCASKCDNGAMF